MDIVEGDERNLLTWRPNIVTDDKGEATVTFFCSDIRSRFYGKVEGIGSDGLLGTGDFTFSVK